ncbi:MAG: nucleotide-binding protein [Gammaproteobacteria bacterium]|nr:nucleotide-binding protein [Gammaproteobacteria bacterium]
MQPTIADELYEFSTAHLVDHDTCNDIREIVEAYIFNTLEMNYYHVMIDGKQVERRPGLGTPKILENTWCNDDADTVPIHGNGELSYRAQSTYSYQQKLPLWITSGKGEAEPLHSADEYIDQWSGISSEKLPKYRNTSKPQIKTSIIVPLRQGEGHVFGFLCVESERFHYINEPSKAALLRMADAIGATLASHEDYVKKQNNTRSALNRLKRFALDNKCTSPLAKPTIFIASSERADNKVMGIIRDIVSGFSAQLTPHYWKEDKKAGDIPTQIHESISQCRFGICYFSELSEKKGQESTKAEYVDNPNVMFEAGMLHSLSQSSTASPQACILVREKDSQKPPFDIAHERIVEVERLGSERAELNSERLHDDLRRSLEELLKAFPSW